MTTLRDRESKGQGRAVKEREPSVESLGDIRLGACIGRRHGSANMEI